MVCLLQDRREFVIELWSNAEKHRVKMLTVLRSVEEVTAQAQRQAAVIKQRVAKLKVRGGQGPRE